MPAPEMKLFLLFTRGSEQLLPALQGSWLIQLVWFVCSPLLLPLGKSLENQACVQSTGSSTCTIWAPTPRVCPGAWRGR